MMLWAWFLLVLKAVFYMRYYKQFLKHKHLFGVEIWFQAHRILNGLAFIFITIAIIATFAGNNFKWLGPKVNGNSSGTPGVWHSMIGILAYSFVIFQLISSFFRCAPSKKNRLIFSIVHRTFGILSFTLALLNIFIAVKCFTNLYSNPSGAIDVLYCYYAIILICIITNEVQIRFKIRIGLLATLGFLIFSSLIVCIYLTITIACS
ncbi:Ferric-chelate reductase 1 [Strongyloides ratti]|uniref:ascorbate ferrireductase (transmembrane) n=1 Tax=Strongyloides ratti TaxID=34506 RepID=A0A090N058_STRRB|nr:Ferric-chelate reductase 1 [Strongyloides ratti]CEF70110.1 Ferric-chelate reductase 1 [Strongyloides ratti]